MTFFAQMHHIILALISAYSVIEANKEYIDQLNIYILGYKCDISLVGRINLHYDGNIIQYIEVSLDKLKDLRGNKFAYLKILIPDILNVIDKCLYLDSDILCLNELKSMYLNDIKCIGAVNNINDYNYESTIHPYTLDGRKREHKEYKLYFNSGVLLINCKYWREHKISAKCINLGVVYPDRFCDQDAMNEVLKDVVEELPLSYNIKTNFWLNDHILDKLKKIYNIEEMMNNPYILHYATRQKPWNDLGYVGPYKLFHDEVIHIIGKQYKLPYLDHDIPDGYVFSDKEIEERYKNLVKLKNKQNLVLFIF